MLFRKHGRPPVACIGLLGCGVGREPLHSPPTSRAAARPRGAQRFVAIRTSGAVLRGHMVPNSIWVCFRRSREHLVTSGQVPQVLLDQIGIRWQGPWQWKPTAGALAFENGAGLLRSVADSVSFHDSGPLVVIEHGQLLFTAPAPKYAHRSSASGENGRSPQADWSRRTCGTRADIRKDRRKDLRQLLGCAPPIRHVKPYRGKTRGRPACQVRAPPCFSPRVRSPQRTS